MPSKHGMGSHTKPNEGENDIWLTPPMILHALGDFDLDPCACPFPRPWPTAKHHIALPGDGLAEKWFGRVWCNPPYGDKAVQWLEKLSVHGRGTALIFARTETEAWEKWVWEKADGILFIFGRLWFYLPDGTKGGTNGGSPSALIAYGEEDARILRECGIRGAYIDCRINDHGERYQLQSLQGALFP